MANCPRIKSQNAAHTMVVRSDRIGPTRLRARLGEHTVAVGDEVSAIRVVPGNRTLLQSIEPIEKNLSISPSGIGGMCSLNGVLVKKSHDRLDDLHQVCQEERKAGRSRLTQ